MSPHEDVVPAETMGNEVAPKSILPKRRQTHYIHIDLIEKVRSYAYWERKGILEMANMALEGFLKDWSFRRTPR